MEFIDSASEVPLSKEPLCWSSNMNSVDMYQHDNLSCYHFDDAVQMVLFLCSLPKDTGLSLRIRNESDSDSKYGVGITQPNNFLLLLFHDPDGITHSFQAFQELDVLTIEYAFRVDVIPRSPPNKAAMEKNVVIFSHGFSPDVGPNYRYIKSLESYIQRMGNWTVIVPDYRGTYDFETTKHGHSERTRLLLEELACLESKHTRVVLVGKSQGGAVSASVCTPRIVKACKIVGLIMIGAENPLSYNRNFPRPPVQHMSIIHTSGDRVIHPESLRQLSEVWGATFHLLESRIPAAARDKMDNDIAHAYMEKHLFEGSMDIVRASLAACESLTIDNDI